MLKNIFLLSILLIASSSINVFSAQEKETIAVIDFDGQNVSSMDAVIVSGFLRTALVNTGAYTVVERKNMEALLAEQGFQMTGCTTKECAVQIGKILNVKKIVKGNLSKLMGIYYITADIVEVETSQIKVSKRVKSASGEQLANAVDDLADMLVNPGQEPAQPMPVPVPVTKVPAPVRSQSQPPQPQQLMKQPPQTTASQKPVKRANGFIDIFFGSNNGKMDLSFSNTARQIDESELSMDFHFGAGYPEAYSEISFEDLETDASMPIGIRLSVFNNALGMDVELSYSKVLTIDQDTQATYDNSRTVNFDFGWSSEYLSVKSFAMAIDLLLSPGNNFRPYIGAGLGMTINKIESAYIKQWYNAGTASSIFKTPLDQTSLGLLVRIPMGFRYTFDNSFGIFGEYRYSRNYFTFDRNINSEKDSIILTAGQLLFGISVGF
ncbi:CsgG/HfaB family protein [Elusimicrobiota bacterium]